MNPVLKYLLEFFAAVLIGFGVTYTAKTCSAGGPARKPAAKAPDSDDKETAPQESVAELVPIPVPTVSTMPVITSINGPSFNFRTRSYSVSVKADIESGDALQYVLNDEAGMQVRTAPDGRFTVPQSRSGKYQIAAENVSTGEKATAYITGCGEVKLTPERIEQICNSGDYSLIQISEAYGFVDTPYFVFSGISESSLPRTIDEICTRISLDIWSRVDVTSISYDDLNRVSSITFKVTK